ncbi:hypothetical protein CYMTET_52058 [Cymbomonas tetramitiformis]|uniref:CS domain-containing protein n=1 Tax=Cymbomonas tetramitiformis TaxID=36881 RepID=A0AAE0BJR7_9CHLO|nr:hypothetical protein CYMTET_52058 [Cymbomonas tetramitiformis]
MSPLAPNFKWAERADKVYITIEIADVKDPKIEISEDGQLTFAATGSDAKDYALDIKLFKGLNKEESKFAVTGRAIVFVLIKAEEEWWNRLLPEGVKMHNCKVDFDKWADEDDDDAKDVDTSGMDMNSMAGMGGMGGMPGMGGMGGMGGEGGGMDMAALQQMMASMGGAGAMGGMGGADGAEDGAEGEEDVDDEDVPPLEDAA